MKSAIIYTKTTCPYCVAAKDLLEHKGIPYEECNVDTNKDAMREWQSLGRATVPQIILTEGKTSALVGGCDDLYVLASHGKL